MIKYIVLPCLEVESFLSGFLIFLQCFIRFSLNTSKLLSAKPSECQAEVLGPNRAQPWVPAAGILGRAGAPQPARHLPSLAQYYGSQCLFCPLFSLICFPLHSSLPCIRSQPSHLQAGIAALHPAHGGLAAFPAHCCSSGRRRGLQKYERILKTKASSVQ